MYLLSTDVTMGACEHANMTYYDGESFMEDLCTMCQCNNGTVTCVTETCPECEQGTHPVNVSNQCCPRCLPGKIRSCDTFIKLIMTSQSVS